MALFRTGGGGMSETVLWTNPSPTSSFAESTVTLSQDIDNFTYIGFRFRASTSNDSSSENLVRPANIKNSLMDSTHARVTIAATISTYMFTRGIKYISDTSLNIGDALRVNASAKTNTNVIPTSIVGYN